MFGLYFNLTKKSNVIDNLQYDFWSFGSGLLFWATLYVIIVTT